MSGKRARRSLSTPAVIAAELVRAYGDHCAPTVVPLARDFEARVSGIDVSIAVAGVREVLTGRISGFRHLAARYWARCLPERQRDACVACLPTLERYVRSLDKQTAALFEDARVTRGLKDAAEYFRGHQFPDEATACRLALQLLTNNSDTGKAGEAVSAAIRTRSVRALTHMKVVVPFLHSESLEERLCGLGQFLNAQAQSPSTYRTVLRLVRKELLPFCDAPEPLAREFAHAILQHLVVGLVARGGYVEALPIVDRLIDFGLQEPTNHMRRYMCRIVAGDERGAATDLETARTLTDDAGNFIVEGMYIPMSFDDALASTQAEAGLALHSYSLGKSPGEFALNNDLRSPAVLAERARFHMKAARERLLARAEAHPDEVAKYWEFTLQRIEQKLTKG